MIGLCGGITSQLIAHGSGRRGAPITVYWERGATVQEPVCPGLDGGGCVDTDGNTYLTLDGGSHGIVKATANGTGLAHQVGDSTGIDAVGCTGCTIENLTIENIYVRTSTSDEALCGSSDENLGIRFSGSNLRIADNTLHDVSWALESSFLPGNAHDSVDGNDVYNVDHGFVTAAEGTYTYGPVYFYDNHIHDEVAWDDPEDCFHHDAIHCYTSDGGVAHIAGLYIYDNVFDGNNGYDMSSLFFDEADAAGTPCSDNTSPIYVFNNLLRAPNPSGPADSNIYDGTGEMFVYNNTFIGPRRTACGSCGRGGSGGADPGCFAAIPTTGPLTMYNNAFTNCDYLNSLYSATLSTPEDYDVYAPGGENAFSCNDRPLPFTRAAFGSWRSCTGGDRQGCVTTGSGAGSCRGHQTSLELDSSYTPYSRSPLIDAGENLTSLCRDQANPGLGALCYRLNATSVLKAGAGVRQTPGAARPAKGPWDAGAQ